MGLSDVVEPFCDVIEWLSDVIGKEKEVKKH
jgi:hypothetical protein